MTTTTSPARELSVDRAVHLAGRIRRAATGLAMRPAIAAETAHLAAAWALPPDSPAELRERLLREAAVDRVAFAPESPGTRSLVERLLDGDVGMRFPVGPEEAVLLDRWRGGGIEAYFDVARTDGHDAELRCLEDEMTYVVVGGADQGLRGISCGSLVVGRVLPVGDVWVLGNELKPFSPWNRREALGDALGQMARHPGRQYRNPRLRAMAAGIVARHHRAFVRLVGTDVVEGSPDELHDCLTRFEDAVGSTGDLFLPVELVRDLDWLELTAGGGAHRAALVHHPVKGARLIATYRELRDLHESGTPGIGAARRLLEDPMVPSWMLERLADQHPGHVQSVYGGVVGAESVSPAAFRAYLDEREPYCDPELPGILLVPSWVDELERV